MARKFDPKHIEKLDNPQRRQTMPPKETLVNLGLKPGDIFADIGCGIGYFTLPASEIVSPDGNVYAVDTSETMMAELEKRLKKHPQKNIIRIKSAEYEPVVPPDSSTFVFLANVLHEIENKDRLLTELHGVLREKGKIAVIDWAKKEMPMGPPLEHRLDKKDAETLLVKNGFSNVRFIPVHEYFYALTAVKD
ncbi:MAG: methyltransferase domain-containing protein [bacterium]|nr:methyltransferase domain-containing protein [bacterium]